MFPSYAIPEGFHRKKFDDQPKLLVSRELRCVQKNELPGARGLGKLIERRRERVKVRAAGFLPGVLLFSDLSFEKFSPGFYFFPKSKNSFAGSYFFLEFSHIVCCF